ncbi:hypothetical protein AB0I77_00125 [Streptomyces sp. NPDC050619]|uniref:hypothetical protein n=1 Tax=Streptomyces sp. NPDC050619 TaxID=3157214 RepID=UPI003436C0CB
MAAAAVLAGGVATVAQTSASAAGTSSTVSAADVVDARADGRDLFSGLYFGQGPIGKKLINSEAFMGDRTGELKKNGTPDRRKMIAALTAVIDKSSPDFFARFSEDIRSGDPYTVQKAFENGINELNKVAKIQKDDGTGTGKCFAALNAIAYANVGYLANVVAGLNFATQANVLFELNFWWGSSSSGTGSLSEEEQIARFTEQLRAI